MGDKWRSGNAYYYSRLFIKKHNVQLFNNTEDLTNECNYLFYFENKGEIYGADNLITFIDKKDFLSSAQYNGKVILMLEPCIRDKNQKENKINIYQSFILQKHKRNVEAVKSATEVLMKNNLEFISPLIHSYDGYLSLEENMFAKFMRRLLFDCLAGFEFIDEENDETDISLTC